MCVAVYVVCGVCGSDDSKHAVSFQGHAHVQLIKNATELLQG